MKRVLSRSLKWRISRSWWILLFAKTPITVTVSRPDSGSIVSERAKEASHQRQYHQVLQIVRDEVALEELGNNVAADQSQGQADQQNFQEGQQRIGCMTCAAAFGHNKVEDQHGQGCTDGIDENAFPHQHRIDALIGAHCAAEAQ